MYRCPKCRGKVTLLQFALHTRWKPITCKNCGVILRISQKQLWKISAPLLLFIILSTASRLALTNYTRRIGAFFLAFGTIATIYCIYGLFSIKLEINNG